MKAVPWILSISIHLLFFLTGLFFFDRPPVYGIESGKNSVELDLVAAASEPTPPETQTPIPPPPVQPDPIPDPDQDVETTVAPPQPPKAIEPKPPDPEPPKQIKPPTVERGDGSSPQPGKNAITLHSDAGALPTVTPDYLRNPAPIYPDFARRNKEEGMVVLSVIVDTEGRPESIEVSNGSGYSLLDESALKAVRGWRFRPATIGGVHIRSHVLVPIRFRLDN